MNDFSAFSDTETIKALHLQSRAAIVPKEVAAQLPSFRPAMKLHDIWTNLPGSPPAAKLITPHLLGKDLLPLMYILDVVDDGNDFRWRLFGTAHTARYGAEATGMLMSNAAHRDSSARDSLAMARDAYKTGRPLFFLTEFSNEGRIVKSSSTIVLPLSGPDGTISRLFGCADWH